MFSTKQLSKRDFVLMTFFVMFGHDIWKYSGIFLGRSVIERYVEISTELQKKHKSC